MIQVRRSSSRLAQTREALERHRGELALIHAAAEAANESASLQAVLHEVIEMTCEHMGWPVGHAFAVKGNPPRLRSLDVWYLDEPEAAAPFRAATEAMHGDVVQRLFDELAPVSVATDDRTFLRRESARALGLTHYFAVPILCGTEVVAALEFLSAKPPSQPLDHLLMLLANIAAALGRVAERELRERQRVLLIRTELAREEAVQRAAELQRLAGELRRRNRELDQFAYVASHDLRAPLRGIANLAGWIAQDLEPHLTDDTHRYLELLQGRVKRMESLIDGLLEYSRIGRKALPSEEIDVGAQVREIADLLSAGREGADASPGVEWVIGELPRVRGQRVMLRQVFHNLLSNAVKYTTCEHPRVEIFAAREGHDTWRFFVRDNGPGIAPRYHERIWEIFQTLQPRDEVEGTGIGLSLVRKIVEQRGGEVGVDSTPGEGACFSFTWPSNGHENGQPEPHYARWPESGPAS